MLDALVSVLRLPLTVLARQMLRHLARHNKAHGIKLLDGGLSTVVIACRFNTAREAIQLYESVKIPAPPPQPCRECGRTNAE